MKTKKMITLFLVMFITIASLTGCETKPDAPNRQSTGQSAANSQSNANSQSTAKSQSNTNRQSIEGLWMGTYIPYGQFAPEFRYLTIYDDGSFFHDIHPEGPENFDIEQSKQDEDMKYYWGYYTFDGKSGVWDYNSADGTSKSQLKLEKSNNLVLGMNHYYRCVNVDGMRLDGAWTTYADPADLDMQEEGDKPIIRFLSDGTFVDEGLFLTGFSYLQYSEGEENIAPGKGIYEIHNYTLKLKYDDGRVRDTSFSLMFSAQKEKTPEIIFVFRRQLNRIK